MSDIVSNVIRHGGVLRIGIVSLSFGKSKKWDFSVWRVVVSGAEVYSGTIYYTALAEFESRVFAYLKGYPNVS